MKPGFFSARYYQKFELNRDPFPPKSTQERLFLTHELSDLVNRLIEGIKRHRHVLVVEAAEGAGKSSLAEYLNYLKSSNWYLSKIQATSSLGETELAHSIISQHFPRHRFDKTQSAVLLREFLQLYQRNGKLPVVIIDDAHLLPGETLNFIIRMSELSCEGERFRFVLFADSKIRKYIERSTFEGSEERICEIFQLPAFSRAQALKYLEHRLSLAGNSERRIFDEANISDWYPESDGLPGKINSFARQQMKKSAVPGRKSLVLKRAALAMAACLILSVGLQAGRNMGAEPSRSNDSVTRSLALPESRGLSLSDSSLVIEKRAAPNKAMASKKAGKGMHGENRQVLLADKKRQQELRLQKQEATRARQEMRRQIAALDALALRVSDVLQN